MTIRAVILGVVIATLLAGFGYYNDSVLRLTMLVGNHLPISVFGLLILAILLLNPLLYLLRRSWRLRPAELAIIVAMMLTAASIPGSGLMRTFLPSLVLPMPMQEEGANVGWQKYRLMDYVPSRMLAADKQNRKPVVDGFIKGLREDQRFALWEVFGTNEHTGAPNVPWSEFSATLSFWLPMIVLTAVCVICMGLIVHRQWASRERLRYPIVELATTLMRQEEGKATPPVVRNKLFWIGLGAVFALHAVNGLATLYPDVMISIPLKFPMQQIGQTWPKLAKGMGGSWLFSPVIWPTVVAFAFFLSTDVSFSLGISQVIMVLATAAIFAAGGDLKFDYMSGGTPSWQLFGSYLGIAMILAYTGRRYYAHVLKQALTFRRHEEVEPYAAWACRFLLLAAIGMVLMLISVGLDWPFAILTVLLILLMFLVMARINAESGLFFIQPYWQPMGVLLGLFGAAALGPRATIIVGLVCMVLTIDPRESLMPFVINGLKMCEDKKVQPGRVGLASTGVYVIGLAVAIVVVFWASYNVGGPQKDGWAWKNVPRFPFQTTNQVVEELDQQIQLQDSVRYDTWQRLASINPRRNFLLSVGIGLVLVLACGLLRLRFTWWPIHPMMFLVWNTFPLMHFSHSFLLGWLIKAAVTKFGGGNGYRRTLPLMIGVIAGDLLGGLTFMVQGAAYYFITGTLLDKRTYTIFPG